jgi:hypothetical protein
MDAFLFEGGVVFHMRRGEAAILLENAFYA